jgi:hypothetical protein
VEKLLGVTVSRRNIHNAERMGWVGERRGEARMAVGGRKSIWAERLAAMGEREDMERRRGTKSCRPKKKPSWLLPLLLFAFTMLS